MSTTVSSTSAPSPETTALVKSPGASGPPATADDLIKCKLFPWINTPAKASIVIQKARETGLAATFVAENIVFVNGKPAASGLMLTALLKGSGKYRYRILTKTDQEVKAEFLEKVDGKWEVVGTEVFTMKMAVRAQLTGNPSWKKFPEAMLTWRALAAGARTHCADALAGGFSHLIEEVRPDLEVTEDGAPVGGMASVGTTQGSTPKPLSGLSEPCVPAGDVIDVEPEVLSPAHSRVADLLSKTDTNGVVFLRAYGKRSVADLTESECVHATKVLESKLNSPKESE